MLESKVGDYWKLAQRYKRATTSLTKRTALDELQNLFNITTHPRLRTAIGNFIAVAKKVEKAG